MDGFKAQIALDDRFEQYKPADNFSNFALHLAAMYKASDMSQSTIAGYFNQMYDLAQGKKAATLFEEADTTKYPLAEIIKKVLNIEYQPAKNGNNNVTNGGADVALRNQVGQGGELRGNEPPASGEQTPTGTEPSDRRAGIEDDSRRGAETVTNNLPEKKEVVFSDPRTMPDSERERRGEMLRNAEAIDVESGQIVATKEISARKFAEKWWDENVGEPIYYGTEVGEVEINRNSIQSSLAHRYGQMKLDAITSLVEGFENAVYLGTMPDFSRQEGVNNHFFAYPINYNGERCYVFCRAMQDANKNRLYVHEVFVSEKIKKGDTLQTAASQPHGGIALYRDILANVLEISSSEGGTSSISHADEAAPAISLESRDDVVSSEKPVSTSSSDIETEPEGKRNGTATPQSELNSDGKDNTLSTEEQISSSQSSEATSSMTDEKVATQPTDSESVELEQPSVQVSVQAASAEVNTTPTPGLDEDYRHLSLNEKKERISDVAQSIELSTGGRVKSHVVTTIADLREAMGDSEDVNTAEWIEDDFVSGDVVAVHSVNSGKIYIFATKMPGKLRTITQIYHEGGHVALARVSDKENLLGTVVDEIERLMPKLASKVRNGYQSYFDRKFPDESDEAKEQVIKEEILVESIAHHIARGTIEDLLGRMSEISRDACITYLEEIGYGRNGQKNITRRQGLNGRVGDDRSTGLGRLEEEYGSHGRTQRKDEDDGYTPDKLSDEAVEDEIGKPINNTKASDDNTLQKDKRDIDVQNSTHVDVKTQQYKLAQKREQEASQAYSEAHRAYQEAGVKWCRKEGIDPHGNHSQEEINSIFERFNNTPEGARLNEARKKAIVAYNRAMAETMIWNIARAFKNLTFNDAKASWDNHNPRYDIEKSIGVDGERVDERKRRIGEAVTELLKDAGIEVVTDAKTVKAEYEKITGEKLADEVDEMLKGLDEKENPGLSSEQLQTQKTKLTGRNSATKVEINSSNIASIRSKLTDLKNKVTNGEIEAETFLSELQTAIVGLNDSSSVYASHKLDNETYRLRVSDHHVNAQNQVSGNHNERKNNTSVVIQLASSKFRPDGRVQLVELVYDPGKLTAEKMEGIVKGVEDWIRTGKYTDTQYDDRLVSPRPKEVSHGVEFLKTRSGEVYGFVKDGKIYLDPEVMNANTPIHEYTHLWDKALQKANPELWSRGKDLLKQTPVWNQVMSDPAYADIATDEDLVASEVHSRLTGKHGESILDKMVEDAKKKGMVEMARAVTLKERIKQWLTDALNWVRDAFGRWSDKDLKSMTVDEFVKMPIKDLAREVNPEEMKRKGEQLQRINETNPPMDDYHTWIRAASDVKTFDEMYRQAEADYAEYGDMTYPDMSIEQLREAKETGYITVYSSKPIKDGNFVTPSRMNAEDYAGGGKVYSKRVPVDSIAWIGEDEGQMAEVSHSRASEAPMQMMFLGEKAAHRLDLKDEGRRRVEASFENRRDKAIADRGTVTPGLADMEVEVVDVARHPFKGTAREAIKKALEWAHNNLVGNYNESPIGSYEISEKAVRKYLSASAISKSENLGVQLAVLQALPNVITHSILAETHPDYIKQNGLRITANGLNGDLLVHRLYGAVEIDGNIYRVKTTMHEFVNSVNRPHSYEVTKIEILDAPMTDPAKDGRTQSTMAMTPRTSISATKLLQGVEKSYDKGKKLLDESAKDVAKQEIYSPGQEEAEIINRLGDDKANKQHTYEVTKILQGAEIHNKSGEKILQESKMADEASHQQEMAQTSLSTKRGHAEKLSKKFNTPIRIVEDRGELTHDDPQILGRMRRSKGWYDTETGEVVVVIPNNNNVADIEQTVLHEVVGHKGLKALVGRDNFKRFIHRVYDGVSRETRMAINALAAKNGWP